MCLEVKILAATKSATKCARVQNTAIQYREVQNSAMQYRKCEKYEKILKITNLANNC